MYIEIILWKLKLILKSHYIKKFMFVFQPDGIIHTFIITIS